VQPASESSRHANWSTPSQAKVEDTALMAL